MMMRIAALAGSVFMDAMRRKVVLLVAFFGFIMAVAIPSLPSYGVGVEAAVFREVSLALSYVGAVVLALALSANRIPGEIERRTVYNVLAKPVDRIEYVVGTWVGIFGVVGGMIAAFTVIEQVVGVVRYGDAMWRLWQGAFAIWLESGALSAAAVAISAISGPVVVVIGTAALAFIGHAREGVLGSQSSLFAYRLYPSLDTFNVINPVAHGTGIGLEYAAGMVLSFAGWVGILLLLGVAAFRGRDL